MLPLGSILDRIGRHRVIQDLAGYGAQIEEATDGLKVRFPNGTIWLVRLAVSALGDPPWPSEAERAQLIEAAEGLGAVAVLARGRLIRPRRNRRSKIRYYDLKVYRETHPGLFFIPGG